MNRMIAPGAVLPEILRRHADVVLARIKHCAEQRPARMVSATMVEWLLNAMERSPGKQEPQSHSLLHVWCRGWWRTGEGLKMQGRKYSVQFS